jgi:Tol biopolymer transport system component
MTAHRRTWFVAVIVATCAAAFGTEQANAGKPAKPSKPSGGPRVISYSTSDKLMTMDESGGNPFTVASDASADFYGARWSPDGSRLGGYEKRIGEGAFDYGLMTIRADGTDERLVVSYAEVDALNVLQGKLSVHDERFDPAFFHAFGGSAWSPDGRYLVFAATVVYPPTPVYSGKSSCLYVADLWHEEPLRQLTDYPTFFWGDATPHWSATEDKIVFQSQRVDPGPAWHPGLWVMNPDGTGLARIRIGETDLPDLYYWPVWSHQRHWATGRPQIAVHPANQVPLILDVNLAADPPTAHVLPLPDIEMDAPAWSADDSQFVYSRRVYPSRGPSYFEIAILDLLTLEERVLLQSKKYLAAPDWNPVKPSP